MEIKTVHRPATDTTGSAIRATLVLNNRRKQLTIPYDYALNPHQVHERAATKLAHKWFDVTDILANGGHATGYDFVVSGIVK